MGNVRRFKRIYVEITNVCNLSCSFCPETKRDKRFMSIDEFQHIMNELKPYTNYIYLHVKGEPMLHPQLADILDICHNNNIHINITTNGTLLARNLETLLAHPVHQINISVHGADDNITVDFEQYIQELFHCCNLINEKTNTEISLRLWNTPTNPTLFDQNNFRIRQHLHINVASPFEWPDVDNSYCNNRGFCQGLRTHIAILCDGTVVPCCLDGNGIMALGNILTTPLTDILAGDRCTNIIEGFHAMKTVEPLCTHCSFKERFSKKLGSGESH